MGHKNPFLTLPVHGDLHGGPFGRRNRAPAVGAAPPRSPGPARCIPGTAQAYTISTALVDTVELFSLVTFIGFYLFSALSDHVAASGLQSGWSAWSVR